MKYLYILIGIGVADVIVARIISGVARPNNAALVKIPGHGPMPPIFCKHTLATPKQ